jgi:hypothetical protein
LCGGRVGERRGGLLAGATFLKLRSLWVVWHVRNGGRLAKQQKKQKPTKIITKKKKSKPKKKTNTKTKAKKETEIETENNKNKKILKQKNNNPKLKLKQNQNRNRRENRNNSDSKYKCKSKSKTNETPPIPKRTLRQCFGLGGLGACHHNVHLHCLQLLLVRND